MEEREDLKWRPRLKTRGRAENQTETGLRAASALSAMRRIEKIRAVGGEPGHGEISMIAGVQQAAKRPEAKRSPAKPALLLALLVALAVAGLASATARTSHRVSGSVRLGTASVRTDLMFHPEEGDPTTAKTSHSGEFAVNGLQPGVYRITLHNTEGPQGRTNTEDYESPESTPFVVTIARDIDHMSLQVSPKDRRPTNAR